MTISIRQVRPADLLSAHAVETAAYPEEERDSLEMFRRRIEHFSEGFLVAEENGLIVGVLNCARTDAGRVDDAGIRDMSRHVVHGRNVAILTVATLPSHRRRGVATALLSEIVARARLGGIDKLLLFCHEELIPFYRRHGFSLVGPSRLPLPTPGWFDMERALGRNR